MRRAISRSPRGDDPDFLNTAWSLNVFRGAFLWLLTCVLAWPAAWFYAVPELALMLPLAGLTLLIGGFNPTLALPLDKFVDSVLAGKFWQARALRRGSFRDPRAGHHSVAGFVGCVILGLGVQVLGIRFVVLEGREGSDGVFAAVAEVQHRGSPATNKPLPDLFPPRLAFVVSPTP